MIRTLVFLAVVASYGWIMPIGAAQERTNHSITHYEIDVPAGYTLRNVMPASEDFELYEVGHVGRKAATLVLYFGNHPEFPKLKWSVPVQVRVRNGATVKEYAYSRGRSQLEGLIIFDGLTYKKSHGSPFTSIHYFSTGVKDDEARDFAAIIKSIRVSKPHLD